MANMQMKRCSTPLVIRKPIIKTKMKFQYASIKMAEIKRYRYKSIGKVVEKLRLIPCHWDYEIPQPL